MASRFLSLVAHFVVTVVIFLSKVSNVVFEKPVEFIAQIMSNEFAAQILTLFILHQVNSLLYNRY